MKILIFEYITGGGLVDQDLPASLAWEGEMMLASVVSNFEDLSDMHVLSLRDYRLTSKSRSKNEIIIGSNDSCITEIDKIADQLDALLIIAPETNGVLASLCKQFSNRSFILLNSSINSIELTTNKLATYKYLHEHNISLVPTYTFNNFKGLDAQKFVVKPIDGVGCDGLYLFDNQTDIHQAIEESDFENCIVQPYIEGKHASLSLMCWDGDCILLSCNRQNILNENGKLRLLSCDVNTLDIDEFKMISKQVANALPGLRGYTGVDILITKNEIILVEINPRLTTSYVGIRQALGINPAEVMLQCFMHKKLPRVNITNNNKVTINIETSCAA